MGLIRFADEVTSALAGLITRGAAAAALALALALALLTPASYVVVAASSTASLLHGPVRDCGVGTDLHPAQRPARATTTAAAVD